MRRQGRDSSEQGMPRRFLRIEKSWINLARSYEFAMELLGKREIAALDSFDSGLMPSSRFH
jgi:hypothetical protein